MKKLVSNIEFGKLCKEKLFSDGMTFQWYFEERNKYDELLYKPLTLSMFVPTDENGCVLEEPTSMAHYLWIEYQQAKSKVIFEGFEIKERSCNDSVFKYIENGLIAIYYFNNQSEKFEANTDFKTIEDLIPYNLTLTDKI